jgi:CsoR family transcriptional regulator, copper-sensing transcriptional repressor
MTAATVPPVVHVARPSRKIPRPGMRVAKPTSPAAAPVGYVDNKEAVLARLRRIEGQVRGIQRMVEDERYCIDVLTQANAVKAAVEKVSLLLLNDHISHCVADAIRGGDSSAKMTELTAAIERFVKG